MPSRVRIEPGATVELVVAGSAHEDVLPGVAIDPPYSDVAPLLDPALLEQIRRRCETPAAVRDVVALAAVPARGWFAVMWLLKYGVLRVAAHG